MSPDASWTFDPGVLIVVGVLGFVYVRRWWQVRTTAGRVGARGAPAWRLAAFLSGLALILVALASPVDRLGEQLLFMHMAQHVLLLDLAPILLILGLTRAILRPGTRRLQRVEVRAGWLAYPAFAVVFYAAAMWLWHLPALYDLAASTPTVHVLEHLTFTLAGGLYWWHVLSPIPGRHRLTGLAPVTYMASTKVAVGLLGIVLTFAPAALYAFYDDQPRYWGLSATEDQQIAGLIMATEQSIVMGIAIAWLFTRMLTESEREQQRAERYEAA